MGPPRSCPSSSRAAQQATSRAGRALRANGTLRAAATIAAVTAVLAVPTRRPLLAAWSTAALATRAVLTSGSRFPVVAVLSVVPVRPVRPVIPVLAVRAVLARQALGAAIPPRPAGRRLWRGSIAPQTCALSLHRFELEDGGIGSRRLGRV